MRLLDYEVKTETETKTNDLRHRFSPLFFVNTITVFEIQPKIAS